MVPVDSDRIPRVPPYSGGNSEISSLPVRDCHPLRSNFPESSSSNDIYLLLLLQPRLCRNKTGLGSVHFDRHYFGHRSFLSFPAGTKMFQFPTFAPIKGDRPSACRVAPFGNPRIKTCLRFPVAYRSLPRPSSPPEAKASSVRSSLLSLFVNLLRLPKHSHASRLLNS